MVESLFEHWLQTASSRQSDTAVIHGEQSVSFSMMDLEINRIQSQIPILPKNLKNHAVIFSMQNSIEWLAVFLLCQKFGAIALPVDTDLPDPAIESIIQSTKPRMVLRNNSWKIIEYAKSYHAASLIKLTSGSTGIPKPYVFTSEQMLADCRNICTTMGINRDSVNFGLIPFGHSYGLGNLVLPFIVSGTPIVIARDFFPGAVAKDIELHKPTVFPAIPQVLKSFLDAEIDPAQLSSLTKIISAGSPLSQELARDFHEKFNLKIHNFYGSSETGGIAYDDTGDCVLSGFGIGKALNNVDITISASGRIIVCSDAVFTRHNKNRRNGKGVHILNDYGSLDNNGILHLSSRSSSILKIAGRRVDLREIESTLLKMQGVSQAYISPVNRGSHQRILAIVETTQSKTLVKEQLRQYLPKWKTPHHWIVTDAFPLNSRGKPNRFKLKEWVREFEAK